VKRLYLRALFVAIVAVSIPALFLRSGGRVSLDNVLDVSRFRDKALPELLQRIRDFHRVVTRNGQRLLEVSAKEASYFKGERGVEIVEPKLVFYDDGEKTGWISGKRGRVYLAGNDVESVELSGAVELKLAQFEVTAEKLVYRRDEDLIIAPGHAVIRSAELVLSGQGLTLDLHSRKLRVDAEVDMTLKATDDTDADADADADAAESALGDRTRGWSLP
jgi:LPS export ABC transporter protein LptC